MPEFHVFATGHAGELRDTIRQFFDGHHAGERIRARLRGAEFVLETDAPVCVEPDW